jgi:hypothetical protein
MSSLQLKVITTTEEFQNNIVDAEDVNTNAKIEFVVKDNEKKDDEDDVNGGNLFVESSNLKNKRKFSKSYNMNIDSCLQLNDNDKSEEIMSIDNEIKQKRIKKIDDDDDDDDMVNYDIPVKDSNGYNNEDFDDNNDVDDNDNENYDDNNDDDDDSKSTMEVRNGKKKKRKSSSATLLITNNTNHQLLYSNIIGEENSFDVEIRNSLTKNHMKNVQFTKIYTIYIYHKIVSALKLSLSKKHCDINSIDSMWHEIIDAVKENLISLNTPPLHIRASKKSDKTQIEKNADIQKAKDRKALLQTIRNTQNKAVSNSIKQLLKNFSNCEIDDINDLSYCLFDNDIYVGSGVKDNEFIKKLFNGKDVLRRSIMEIDNCNEIVSKQINYLKEEKNKKTSVDKNKQLLLLDAIKEKGNEFENNNSGEIIADKSNNNELKKNPNNIKSQQSTFINSDAQFSSVSTNKDDNNNQNNIFSSSKLDESNPKLFNSYHNAISPFLLSTPSVENSNNNQFQMMNIVSNDKSNFLSSSTTTEVRSNPLLFDNYQKNAISPVLSTPSVENSNNDPLNIVSNDKSNLSSSSKTNICKPTSATVSDGTIITNEMIIAIIFGSQQCIFGKSQKMKICLNKPNSEFVQRKFSQSIQSLLCIFSTYKYDYANTIEEINGEMKEEILSAINALPIHLFLVLDENNNDDLYDPYSLYGELENINYYKNQNPIMVNHDELMVSNSSKLFQIVNLYRQQNENPAQNFPIKFQGTPSCFSILPYVLFQECNVVMEEDYSSIEEETKIWGILSVYKTLKAEKNYFPSFFSPCFSEINTMIESLSDFFVFHKNGNFTRCQQNRISNSFSKCVDNFIINFINSIKTNIDGNLKLSQLITSAQRNKDNDYESNNNYDFLKTDQSNIQSISKVFNLSLSDAFKIKNPLFHCFNFGGMETNFLCRRNNFLFDNLLKFMDSNKSLAQQNIMNDEMYFDMRYEPLLDRKYVPHLEIWTGNKEKPGPINRFLKKGTWLCDTSVNFVIDVGLLLNNKKKHIAHLGKLYDGYLPDYNSIDNPNYFLVNNPTKKVKDKFRNEWIKNFEKQMWIIPINRKNTHFVLFIVLSPNLISKNKCRILLLDSLNNEERNFTTEDNLDFRRIKLLITEWYNYVFYKKQFTEIYESIISLKLTDIPQQPDGRSCGWFCILYSKFAIGTLF